MKFLALVILCALLGTHLPYAMAQQTADVEQATEREDTNRAVLGRGADLSAGLNPHHCCNDFQSGICSRDDEDSCCADCFFDRGCGSPALSGYYLQTEALFLHRSTTGPNGSNQPLVINTITNATLLSTSQFDNARFQAGSRVLFGRRSIDGHGWEASYFGIDDWRSSARVTGNSDLAIPGDLGLSTVDFFNADTMRVSLATQLHNFEINYLRSFDTISLLSGFRYLNLTEQFQITPSDSATAGEQYRISARNNLFGAQIGARMGRQVGRLSWSVTGKAGIFGNDAMQRQYVEDFPAFILRNTQASSGQVAFVGDLNFSAGYRLNPLWSVRAGYNLIWINGVALAAQQVDFTNTATSGTNVAVNNGLFLHGVNVGLEGHW
jgi:hypothetical protein